MKHPFSFFSRLVLLLGMLLNAPAAFAQSNLAIYSDALGSGWQSWSWNSTLNFSTTAPVHGGADSLSVSYTAGYAGLYLSFPAAINTAGYGSLTFWINGGTSGGQNLQVKAAVAQTLNNGVALNSYIAGGSIAANAWRQVTIPLTALGVANISNLTGIVLQDNTGSVQPTYYVDDMMLTAVAPPATVHITVTPSAVLQTLSSRTFGANTAVWDGQLNTPGTISLLNAQGGGTLRYPGGSTSDDFHWKTNTSNAGGGAGGSNFDAFSNVAVQTHANVYITVNYGSGTSQEAADWVTYANKTKNLGFKYWEIGNECYGNWEQDVNSRPHDPTTYATRAADYITKMKTVDPTIKIGVVVVTGEDSSANYSGATDPYAINPRTGVKHYGWTPIVLSKMKTLGVLPDFLIYHRYDQAPGAENDAALLQSAASWPNDIGDIRQQMNDYLGTSAAQTEIVCTEDNSVYTAPGKQTTSLVNGLFMADSLCNAYKTELKTIIWWDLRNSQETGNNNAASLYGWRQYGDYGMMSAANDCYPTYYAGKIVAQFAHGGDQIVSATSDYSYLSAYAAKRADGSVAVLVINKSPVNTLQGSLALPAQVVRPPVSIVSYGIPQDNAAQTGTGNRDIAASSAAWTANPFAYSFAPYSLTLLIFPSAATVTGKIALEGVANLSGVNTAVPVGTIHFDFRTPGTTTAVSSADVPLAPSGSTAYGTYSIPNLNPGTYDVAIKGSKSLRTVLANVILTGTTALPNVTLRSGDADGNNVVDIADFGLLVNAYGGSASASGTAYDARADFNYDGVVDIADFGILVNEYGSSGAM